MEALLKPATLQRTQDTLRTGGVSGESNQKDKCCKFIVKQFPLRDTNLQQRHRFPSLICLPGGEKYAVLQVTSRKAT
jgi:hypothetical protein